ncbi:MAG: PDZ domain-containing protein [Gemmataceae bacterium]|nr:PDZ domain-containing protein [Gemmataceae bacterium]
MIGRKTQIVMAALALAFSAGQASAQIIVPGLPLTPKAGGLPLDLLKLQQLQLKQLQELQKQIPGGNLPGIGGLLPQDLNKLQEAQRKQLEELLKQIEGINPNLAQPNGRVHFNTAGGGLKWGGMKLGSVTPKDREDLGLPDMEGLAIVAVDPNSDAEKAGVKAKDILVKINGKPVPNDGAGLEKLVKDLNAEKFDIVVLRDGKEETLKGTQMPALVQNNPIGGGGRAGGIQIRNGFMLRGFQITPRPNPNQPKLPMAGIPLQNSSSDINVNGTRIIRKQRGADFTGEFSKDDLRINVGGVIENGAAKVTDITVQDGKDTKKFTSIADAPANYRVIIEQLLPSANRNLVPNIPGIRPKLDDA